MMNELTYHIEGDYLLPDLIPPETSRIGVWGMRRREFLIKRIDVYRDYRVHIDFNIDFEQFQFGLDCRREQEEKPA